MDILKMRIEEMAGADFMCDCGHRHNVGIKQILVGQGVLKETAETVKMLGKKNIYIIDDKNTHEICGKQIQELLSGYNCHIKTFVADRDLVPDEYAIGSALAEMNMDDDLIVAVGSGVINDLTRIVSSRTGIPYIIVATAPSMDGYASTVSPLILDGMKITKEAVYPSSIIADIDILKDAPFKMLTAGYGDIIGKFTSNADWRLSRDINGEYYCDVCADLVNKAVNRCSENGKGFKARKAEAVEYVTQALILSGVAMGLLGNSRPASGAEHHFSHYWEVDALSKGHEHPLHGNSVSVGSVISASLYDLAKDHLPKGFISPDKNRIIEVLNEAGAPVHPKDIDIDVDLFHRSILHAMEIRERYTILRFCQEKGLLDKFADILTETYYS